MTTAPSVLVDSHCHLDFPDFGAERDAIVQRARDAGVGLMLTICTHVSRFAGVHDAAMAYDDVYCTVGIHPHHAADEFAHSDEANLLGLVQQPKVVGIGESGLDYFYDKSPRDLQQESFRRHIRVCLETGLPLVIHTRDAEDDTMRILREEAPNGGLRGLLHCFSGTRKLAEEGLEFGLSVSFSGIVTFKKSDELREVARIVPMDRLLVETDAPFLAPVPMRGKRNEPAFVAHTARHLAEVKGVAADELARATTANFLRMFDRVPATALDRAAKAA